MKTHSQAVKPFAAPLGVHGCLCDRKARERRKRLELRNLSSRPCGLPWSLGCCSRRASTRFRQPPEARKRPCTKECAWWASGRPGEVCRLHYHNARPAGRGRKGLSAGLLKVARASKGGLLFSGADAAAAAGGAAKGTAKSLTENPAQVTQRAAKVATAASAADAGAAADRAAAADGAAESTARRAVSDRELYMGALGARPVAQDVK